MTNELLLATVGAIACIAGLCACAVAFSALKLLRESRKRNEELLNLNDELLNALKRATMAQETTSRSSAETVTWDTQRGMRTWSPKRGTR